VKALVLQVDEGFAAERRRRGADRWDEVWKGLVHMVPPPSERHQSIGSELLVALAGSAAARGLRLRYETGVFAGDDDYRVPDLVAYEGSAAGAQGVVGAPSLIIEIRSPGDETDEKVPWYLARRALEVLVIDRDDLTAELHRLGGPVAPGARGELTLETLAVAVRTDAGTLLITAGERTVVIAPE
jgi:Uma2 family endonuclease